MKTKVHGCQQRIRNCRARIANLFQLSINAPTAKGREMAQRGWTRETALLNSLLVELEQLLIEKNRR